MGERIGLFFKCLLLSCLCIFLAGVIPDQLLAQESTGSGDEFTLEEVVVTGSRIQRRDYESNSPIVTVEAAQFEQQTGLNVESYLNQLPEYNPASSPVTSNGDVQITPVNSVGVATISLRGFGPNRNLTLIDGHRTVPVNAIMWTDINGIPSSLIERVETISGGASAVYGADAVGGVTNFILKKNFEGAEFDVQYGLTEEGDSEEMRISAVIGGNFGDDKGNVTMGVEKYSRGRALARDRDFYVKYWNDPYSPGYFAGFYQGINGYSCNPICGNQGALKALFGGQFPGAWYQGFGPDSGSYNSGLEVKFNQDGTLFTIGNPVGESRMGDYVDGLTYVTQSIFSNQHQNNIYDPPQEFDSFKWYNLNQYISSPQNRYSMYANGHYDLTDRIQVYASANMAESVTKTVLFGTDVITGWEATVPYDPMTDSPIEYGTAAMDWTDPDVLAAVAANPTAFFAQHPNPNFIPTGSEGAGHPVPAELAWLLNSRSNPNARWQPQWYPDKSMPPRQTYNTINTWQIDGGVKFELPFGDWNGDIYWSHGKSSTYNVAGGSLSLARWRALVNYPDYGRGVQGTGNQFYAVDTGGNGSLADVELVSAQRPAFGSGDITCASGLYETIFFDKPMSQDCLEAMYADIQTRTEMTQDIAELNLQGGLVDLPAGTVRTAFGYQYRKVTGMFNPDVLQSEVSFTDQVVGVYPTGYLDASTEVNDLYAEALVPLLANLPFIKKLELELGLRYSRYKETSQDEYTYKTLANWAVMDWMRLRGGYNRATRAPNLGELYLNKQEIFTVGGANYGDPCAIRTNAPWGAAGATADGVHDENVTDAEALVDSLDGVTPNYDGVAHVVNGGSVEQANRTYMICKAMMGQKASDDYYFGIVGGVDEKRDFTQINGGSLFNWIMQVGNPNLKPEVADTWTFGFVLSSPFMNPWVSGMTLNFDWYDIKITDAIMTYSIDYANYRCFGVDTGLTPEEQAASPACALSPRDQNNGAALNTTVSYDNQASIRTRGFDLVFNWHADIKGLGLDVPGSLNLNVHGTFLDTYRTRLSPAPYDFPIEWKGSLGPTLPGTQGGAYDYRLFTTLTYALDAVNASLRWRHLPSVWSAGYAQQQSIKDNNAMVSAGGEGLMAGYTPSTEIKTDAYDVFDLSGNWDISDIFSVRFGITNLFNKEPLNFANTKGRPVGSDLNVCGDAPGCTNPTTYALPTTGGFNGGYYDTLGRRFFVGVKMRF